MERISVSEFPVSEIQKFVRVHNNQELHITACAVSKMAGVDRLSELEEYNNYSVEPNQKWLENQSDPFAWVKVYYDLRGKVDSISKTTGQVQIIELPMQFLGESHKECWGEIQIRVKQKDIKLGRHKCFDTRVGEWVPETKPIVPKKDAGTHGYIALRLYHQSYFPENQPYWHFEPIYAAIAGKKFYRIDAGWFDEKITVVAALLNGNSSEIPEFLR